MAAVAQTRLVLRAGPPGPPGLPGGLGAACVVLLAICLVALPGCATRGLPPVVERSPQLGERPLSYRVRAGDTLYSIAWRYRLDVAELARWNQLGAPYVLQIDRHLRLQPQTNAPVTDSAPASNTKPAPPVTRPASSTPKRAPAAVPAATAWRWPVTATRPLRLARQTFDAEHPGVTFRVPADRRAVAAAPGLVVYAGAGLGGYEHLIILRHADALLSAYSFDGTLRVNEGGAVKVGADLADISTVGRRGSLLYFELRRRGSPIDPRRMIR